MDEKMNEKLEIDDYEMEMKESVASEVGTYENENLEIAIHEVGEDNTKYGEFISTYFAWIPLSKQKERAREMEEMTKKNKQKINSSKEMK